MNAALISPTNLILLNCDPNRQLHNFSSSNPGGGSETTVESAGTDQAEGSGNKQGEQEGETDNNQKSLRLHVSYISCYQW